MIASVFNDTGFDTTDLLIVLAIIGYAIKQIIESKGWSKSSSTLRLENTDLIRRNTDLEQTRDQQMQQIDDLKIKVGILEKEMSELKLRDQAAVLAQLQVVEENAERRHTSLYGVLEKIADNTSHPNGTQLKETQTTETIVTDNRQTKETP